MKTQIQEGVVKAPAFFVPNLGQYAQEALFASSAAHTRFYFMKSRVVHAMELATDEADRPQGVAFSMEFADANPDLSVQGTEPHGGKLHYFIGNDPDHWKTNLPAYGGLRYNDIWEGVSLSMRHTETGVKLDWHLAPGVNPDVIRLTCEGAESLSVGDDGSLVLSHPYGEVREEAPVAYQMIDGRRVEIPCSYRLDGAFSYGFSLGEGYDPVWELIIDPLLPYSTLLGGNSIDEGFAIAADAAGCAYVVGHTESADFPITPGAFQTTLSGSSAAFVTKFSADGSQLVYSTYLGGTTDDTDGYSVAVDDAGHAYVTGRTRCSDFPVTPGAFQTSLGGLHDVYITKLAPDGASLVYSTYLGGSGEDTGYSIRVDAAGSAYVGGDTKSMNFPITVGAFQTSTVGSDGFITKLSADGASLHYSTYLGGSSQSIIFAIAIDAAGFAYATGQTNSADFPVTPGAFQTTLQGNFDVFITKLSTNGSSLVYSTFVGGSGPERGLGICVDGLGNAYATGWTWSTNFPVSAGAAQSTFGGLQDAFVFMLSADGSAMFYSTFLGGANQDVGNAIALNSGGYACVTGQTYSPDFPTTPLVKPSAMPGSSTSAAFLTVVADDGTSFLASSFIGGDNASSGNGVATGAEGSVYVGGFTSSSNFPVTPGAFQTTNHGASDAFVYRTGFVRYAKASLVIIKP